MTDLKGIPLKDQGEPLPVDFPFKGQWLHKGLLFLYQPDDQQISGGKEMTAVAKWENGVCAGISSVLLAPALSVTNEDIFRHNAAATLFLVRTDRIPPVHGGIGAKRYIFQIGERQTAIVIEGDTPVGNA